MTSIKHHEGVALSSVDLGLIFLVTLSWGLNYPIMKSVVVDFPPLSFRAWTFALGCLALGLYTRIFNLSLAVPRSERWKVLQLGVPNMVLWHIGLIYGVYLLQSGRAAMVGYTMPVWALLASVLIYRGRLTLRAVIGVACSLTGTALLLGGEQGALMGQPIGVLFTLAAAMAWGLGTAMTKNTQLHISSLTLTFWMLLLAAAVFAVMAFLLEREAWHWPTLSQWLGIFYAGVWAFAVCYVAWFRVARKLSPVASGLSVVMVPLVGVASGHLFLNEAIQAHDRLALVAIGAAIATVLLPIPRDRVSESNG